MFENSNFANMDELLSYYKNIISENHDYVVDEIKNSIEKLIVQLQERENYLLFEANKWKASQIKSVEEKVKTLSIGRNIESIRKEDIKIDRLHFRDEGLDRIHQAQAEFGQLILHDQDQWFDDIQISNKKSESNNNNDDNIETESEEEPVIETQTTDDFVRIFKSHLNKLANENYQRISVDMAHILRELHADEQFQIVVSELLIEHAILVAGYRKMYASLLAYFIKNDETLNKIGNSKKLSYVFINLLQKKFEKELRSNYTLSKLDFLGLIDFIGELYLLSILTPSIINTCLELLFNERDNESAAAASIRPSEQRLEAGMKLLAKTGAVLDTDVNITSILNNYFNVCQAIVADQSKKRGMKIKFMAMDLIQLRKNKWIPTKSTLE